MVQSHSLAPFSPFSIYKPLVLSWPDRGLRPGCSKNFPPSRNGLDRSVLTAGLLGFIVFLMDYDYSKRGCLLPDGCKNLLDMSKTKGAVVTKVAITEDGFIVSAELPPLHTRQLEIIADGRTLHILCGPGRRERGCLAGYRPGRAAGPATSDR